MGLRKHQSENLEVMRRAGASEAAIQRAISEYEVENTAADKRSKEGFEKRQQSLSQVYGPLTVESRTASNGNKYIIVFGGGLNHTYLWSQSAVKAFQDASTKLNALMGSLPEAPVKKEKVAKKAK